MKAIKLLNMLLVAGLCGLMVGTGSVAFSAPPEKMPRAPSHDVKIFPGNLCAPEYPHTQIDDIVYSMAGGVFVWSSGDQYEYVTCPVVRDDATGTDGVYMGRATVWDNNEYIDLTCCFRSYDKWGVPIASVCDQTVGWGGEEILDFDLDQSAEYGHYTLDCALPFNHYTVSGVIAYRIYEHQDGYDDMTDYDN